MNADPVSFTGQGATEMASTLLECFRSRVLDLYPDEDLMRDLGRLSIQERPSGGYRLSGTRDEHGHADRAMALAIALPLAWQAIGEVVYVDGPPTPPARRFRRGDSRDRRTVRDADLPGLTKKG